MRGIVTVGGSVVVVEGGYLGNGATVVSTVVGGRVEGGREVEGAAVVDGTASVVVVAAAVVVSS